MTKDPKNIRHPLPQPKLRESMISKEIEKSVEIEYSLNGTENDNWVWYHYEEDSE